MHSPIKSNLAELVINRRKTGVVVERDAVYPTMWRVRRRGGRHSDMVNLTRAMEAAVNRAFGPREPIREREVNGEALARPRYAP